ncbi:hypothetical protein J7E73_16255 [Paenibacillus albidus]|nr:hypothetical protein [Paenibacillus albidus]MBT2290652.1 hypothetical protein [Paenibacillus albidus]
MERQIEYGPGGTGFERQADSWRRKTTACSSVNGQFPLRVTDEACAL